jgi:transcription elongation factor Elf1
VNDALTIECPHCGETFSLAFDVSEGSAEFIADCEICCRPMSIVVRVIDGGIDALEVTAD